MKKVGHKLGEPHRLFADKEISLWLLGPRYILDDQVIQFLQGKRLLEKLQRDWGGRGCCSAVPAPFGPQGTNVAL